jgi:hypothetical protein
MSEPEYRYVDPQDLHPGPIVNKDLPADLLEQIGAIYEVIGPYISTTLEQFEISFMRDANPEDEVTIWSCITAVWIKYHEKYLYDQMLPEDEEKKLISTLIAISTGVDDPAILGIDPEIARGLVECWEEITD